MKYNLFLQIVENVQIVVVCRVPRDPKNRKFSKKCFYYQNFIPEPILFISYLGRLSYYQHFGMLDKPSS